MENKKFMIEGYYTIGFSIEVEAENKEDAKDEAIESLPYEAEDINIEFITEIKP